MVGASADFAGENQCWMGVNFLLRVCLNIWCIPPEKNDLEMGMVYIVDGMGYPIQTDLDFRRQITGFHEKVMRLSTKLWDFTQGNR